MKTIANGIILKGLELTPARENILIDDGEIIEISKDVFEGEIIDAEGKIVCPKFLNAHTHIGDTIIKDEGDGLSIGEIVRPPNGIKHLALEAADDEELISAMADSMWNMHDLGISHFMDYREGGIEGVKLLRKASEDIPIEPVILGRDGSFYGDDPDMHEVKIAIRKLLKHADGIGLSGFGEVSTEVAELICRKCSDASKISSIHVAESESVQVDSLEKCGKTEPQRAYEAGFNQIVHMANPKADDVVNLAKSNSSLSICPRSNGALNVGIAPLKDILDLGERPLIGTDNIMLNSPNMFRELEFTLKVMKAYSKSYIPPVDILKLATTNACADEINLPALNKSFIGVGQKEELFVANRKSKNPYLSLINRTEPDDIVYLSK